MCWNPEISISTFILSLASISIGYINNIFDFNHCIFYLSISLMQLLEYLIWIYPKKNINKILSILGLLIIIIQPLCASLIIENKKKRLIYLILYILWIIIFLLIQSPFNFSTIKASNGHLKWNWLKLDNIFIIITWTMFILAAILLGKKSIYEKIITIIFIIFCTLIAWFYYNKSGTFGSVYCSLINIMFIFIIIKALFKQYKCYNIKN